jgi:hypothetical protein
MTDRRHARTATTDMRRTLVRLTATTDPTGLPVVYSSVRGRGITDTMAGLALGQATMAAQAGATVAVPTDAQASVTVAVPTDAQASVTVAVPTDAQASVTVAVPTDTQPSVDAVLQAVQWAASTAASAVDFTVQPEVASTVAVDTAADAANRSRSLSQRRQATKISKEKSPRLRPWA